MSKHTPAPWIIQPCPCGHPSCKKWKLAHPLSIDGRLEEANAHLIAAAPDLLDALLLAVRTVDTNDWRTVAWYDIAVAAIAKARGTV